MPRCFIHKLYLFDDSVCRTFVSAFLSAHLKRFCRDAPRPRNTRPSVSYILMAAFHKAFCLALPARAIMPADDIAYAELRLPAR